MEVIRIEIDADDLAPVLGEMEQDAKDLLKRRDWQSIEEVEEVITNILQNVEYIRDILFS